MINFNFKSNYDINDLIKIVNILRSDFGCPWDKEQTHSSIKRDFIEEVYEVIEAIDLNNTELLKEELGDVLLQVVFHCQIETELSGFNFNDVCNDICHKLIIRHPHVFSDTVVSATSEVLTNWENIKQETKGQTTYFETLDSVAKSLPSLMRAEKVGKRAAKSGMDFEKTSDVLSSLKSELKELEEAIDGKSIEHIEEELGDLLFSCANLARHLKIDSEQALTNSTEKFIDRFSETEKLIRSKGIDMKSLDINELDDYWHQAKFILKTRNE